MSLTHNLSGETINFNGCTVCPVMNRANIRLFYCTVTDYPVFREQNELLKYDGEIDSFALFKQYVTALKTRTDRKYHDDIDRAVAHINGAIREVYTGKDGFVDCDSTPLYFIKDNDFIFFPHDFSGDLSNVCAWNFPYRAY